MLIYKSWKTYDKGYRVKYIWYGYFLFGIVPLYLVRYKAER